MCTLWSRIQTSIYNHCITDINAVTDHDILFLHARCQGLAAWAEVINTLVSAAWSGPISLKTPRDDSQQRKHQQVFWSTWVASAATWPSAPSVASAQGHAGRTGLPCWRIQPPELAKQHVNLPQSLTKKHVVDPLIQKNKKIQSHDRPSLPLRALAFSKFQKVS